MRLRSLTDAQRLRQAAIDADAAVVIGAGFIGCEAATSLARRDVAVTLVAPQTVPQEKRLGAEAGERLRRLVADAGVRYVGGCPSRKFTITQSGSTTASRSTAI